jgi:hypothetical protein
MSKSSGKRLPAIEDELEFKENLCSLKARKISEITEEIDIDIWYDKHYHDRHFIGDENGKRDGIVKHLFLYSGLLSGVSFINHRPSGRAVRIVLQESVGGFLLNVAIEVHFVKISLYQITVKTAMRHDEFKMSDNQYIIELDGDGSVLKKFENKRFKEICKF